MHEQVDTNPIYKPNRPEEGKSKHDPKPKLTSCSNWRNWSIWMKASNDAKADTEPDTDKCKNLDRTSR